MILHMVNTRAKFIFHVDVAAAPQTERSQTTHIFCKMLTEIAKLLLFFLLNGFAMVRMEKLFNLDILSHPGALFAGSPLTKLFSDPAINEKLNTSTTTVRSIILQTPALPVFPSDDAPGLTEKSEVSVPSVAHDDQLAPTVAHSTLPPPRITGSTSATKSTTSRPSLSHGELLEHYGLNPAANVLSVYMANFLTSLNKDQLVSFLQLFFYQQQAAVMGLNDMSKVNGFLSAAESARAVPNLKGHMDGFQRTGLAQIFGTMSQQFVAAKPESRQLLLMDFNQQIQNLKLPEDLRTTLRTVLHNSVRAMGIPSNSGRPQVQ